MNGDGDPVSYGCAIGFIYYLTVQLGFSINEVIANYSGNLFSCYQGVTEDWTDPFPGFTAILGHVFPPGQSATLTGANPNNPFPIASVQFYSQKNTFGKDETQDIISHHGGLISSAFWVVIDGLSRQAFQNLGVQVGALTGAFANLPGVRFSQACPEFQNNVHPKSPQRIRIPFDIRLSQPVIGQFPPTGVSAPLDLSTILTAGGALVSGSNATMDFELIAAGDPYFDNIDPTQNNEPYLSQDLRVFNSAPGISATPFPGGPAFSQDSVAGACNYIQALLAYLNGTAAFTNPAGWTLSHCCRVSRERARRTAPWHRLRLRSTNRDCRWLFSTTTTSQSPGYGCAAHPARQVRQPRCAYSSASSPAKVPTPISTRPGPTSRAVRQRRRCRGPVKQACPSSQQATSGLRPITNQTEPTSTT